LWALLLYGGRLVTVLLFVVTMPSAPLTRAIQVPLTATWSRVPSRCMDEQAQLAIVPPALSLLLWWREQYSRGVDAVEQGDEQQLSPAAAGDERGHPDGDQGATEQEGTRVGGGQ
jgi:hypothetical protein